MQREILETHGTGGIRLGVVFHWQADRFGHSICLLEAGGTHLPLLESIEGLPPDDWPQSPPLQSLHCESLPDGTRVALLVGMAGKGHWSASIGPRADENRLVFDVACRASESGGQLGTSYRLPKEVVVELATSDQLRLQVAGCAVGIVASQEQATRCELIAANAAEMRIQPVVAVTASRTRRWLYDIAVQR